MSDLAMLRLSRFFPPDGWVVHWLLSDETRVYYAQRVIAAEKFSAQRKAETPKGEMSDDA